MTTVCPLCGVDVGASGCIRCDGDKQVQPLNRWFLFAIASVLLVGFTAPIIRSMLGIGSETTARDLSSFWISGWAATHHLDPYGLYPLTWHLHAFPYNRGPLIYDVNLNPPCLLPLFQLFARFDLRQLVVGWTVVSALCFIAGAGLVLFVMQGRMQKRQVLWLLWSQAALMTLWFGQIYSLLFLLACVAWALLRMEKTVAAAICIGVLVAMKPNLGFWPVMLFLAGYKRPAVISAVTVAALSVVPAILYGPGVYWQWLHAHSLVSHYLFPADVSIAGFFARVGFRVAGEILAVVVTLGLLAFVYRRRPSPMDIGGIAVCAGLLCAPLAWVEYVLVAAPFWAGGRRWGWLETCAVALLFFPEVLTALMMGRGPWVTLAAGLPYFVAVWMVLWSFLRGMGRVVRC